MFIFTIDSIIIIWVYFSLPSKKIYGAQQTVSHPTSPLMSLLGAPWPLSIPLSPYFYHYLESWSYSISPIVGLSPLLQLLTTKSHWLIIFMGAHFEKLLFHKSHTIFMRCFRRRRRRWVNQTRPSLSWRPLHWWWFSGSDSILEGDVKMASEVKGDKRVSKQVKDIHLYDSGTLIKLFFPSTPNELIANGRSSCIIKLKGVINTMKTIFVGKSRIFLGSTPNWQGWNWDLAS